MKENIWSSPWKRSRHHQPYSDLESPGSGVRKYSALVMFPRKLWGGGCPDPSPSRQSARSCQALLRCLAVSRIHRVYALTDIHSPTIRESLKSLCIAWYVAKSEFALCFGILRFCWEDRTTKWEEWNPWKTLITFFVSLIQRRKSNISRKFPGAG